MNEVNTIQYNTIQYKGVNKQSPESANGTLEGGGYTYTSIQLRYRAVVFLQRKKNHAVTVFQDQALRLTSSSRPKVNTVATMFGVI